MRIVVTGGAGFLGSHLCGYLLDQNHFVICIDNFITGHPDNISHLFGNDRFLFIKHDITKYIYVEGPVDIIFHLASPASPADFQKIPIQILKVGSLGTHNALGLARNKNAFFVLASTSEVYGDPKVHPQKEDYWGNVNPVGLRAAYDESKRFAEALTMAYHRIHGVPTRIARIFNTYGARMRFDDGRVLPNFIYQCLNGKPITIFGDGSQTRSFCYVSDLIEGLYALYEKGDEYPTNLGNPEEISILEFAREIKNITGSNSEIVFEPLRDDDPKLRCPDITRARKLLGWEPKVSREDGLKKTVEFFRAERAKR